MTGCTGCVALAAKVEHLEEMIDGLSALLKVDASDVCAVVDENTRLRERDAEIRKRAETLVEELRGGLQITGSFCNYCKQAFTSILGDTPDTHAALAREHDKTCAANPLVIQLGVTQAALTKACGMLDDAVQLRDDAREWFPHIAELRKVGTKP